MKSRRCLVIGGFEPSGHDTTEEAIVEAGRERNFQIDILRWRDLAPELGTHPMFTAHRYAAGRNAATVAGLLDEEWIARLLAEDLASCIPLGFDTYVSVHPWSSTVCAEALVRSGKDRATLIDYTSEFSAFPLVVHDRVNAYLGGGAVRPLEPKYRARCSSVGVAVPRRFHASADGGMRDSRLVVSAGSDGWAISAMLPSVSLLAETLAPKNIVLLAPTPEAVTAWKRHDIANARIAEGITDISALLKESRWYLSKGGGTAVAEGLVARCEGFVASSGIFWEEDSSMFLAAHGVIALVGRMSRLDEDARRHERNRCLTAASSVWECVRTGSIPQANARELEVLTALIERSDDIPEDGTIPSTTRMLRQRLRDWRDGWALDVKA